MFGLLINVLRAVGQAVASVWTVAAALAAPVAAVATSGLVGTAVTVGAVVAATATVGYGVYYATTGQPIVFFPGLPDVPLLGPVVKAQPPRYVVSVSGVKSPLGVALSPNGERIYVTESEGERAVRVFDREGRPLQTLVPPGSGGRLPAYVAVDQEGKVYVTDRLRNKIDTYAPDGAYLGVFQPAGAPGMVPNPLGIAISKPGMLYLTDASTGNHRVMAFDKDRLKQAFGRQGTGKGEFNYPNALAVDEARGQMFVSDSNNARVLIFDAESNLQEQITAGGDEPLGLPRGLALDSVGRLYVVDNVGSKVMVFDTRQTPPPFLFAFGDFGNGDGQFVFPNGIAVDNTAGRIYVADNGNDRVSVWAY